MDCDVPECQGDGQHNSRGTCLLVVTLSRLTYVPHQTKHAMLSILQSYRTSADANMVLRCLLAAGFTPRKRGSIFVSVALKQLALSNAGPMILGPLTESDVKS